ncbi:hypothetical protein CERSUDRAFT_73306 [Gelatoporia subvermispora B]|uniref:Uncharacterized protein n=1 Tax=Ceriporiopsis subvermispora (strain B) TaxID=914234 RepID=M2PM03_CERS8|nr:hypothetical protein CERSUDRAFT_73306 [Gelatoporia subvermispora B]
MRNSTTLDTTRGFVAGPSIRGTMDIFWSCSSALALCTWTAIYRRRAMNVGSVAVEKVALAILFILVPEILLTRALCEVLEARHSVALYRKYGEEIAGEEWSIDVVRHASMGGFSLEDKRPLTMEDILILIRHRFISTQQPYLMKIEGPRRAIMFLKTIACIQALWLGAQCIAREAIGLPISTLEIGTLGYVLLALVIQAVDWLLPQHGDVVMPIFLLPGKTYQDAGRIMQQPSGIEHTKSRSEIYETRFAGILCIAACIGFGLWCCLAWNNEFPSRIEQKMWRICSILSMFPLPAIALSISVLDPSLHPDGSLRHLISKIIFPLVLGLSVALYTFVRFFVVVEMFIGLRQMPAGVFHAIPWADFLPHI